MTDFPVFYANNIIGLTGRASRTMQVTLGADGFLDEVVPVLGLGMPIETARQLGKALAKATSDPDDQSDEDAERSVQQNYEELKRNALRLGMTLLSVQSFAGRIMRAYRDQPDFAKTVARVRARAVSDLKGVVTEGLGMDDEATITTAALAEFEKSLDLVQVIAERDD